MTGNGDREFVLGARTGDRAYRLWTSDASRDLGIGNGLADGNLMKRPPHTLLEGGTTHVERKAQANSGFLNEGDNPCNQSLIVPIGANEMRLREAILEIAHELVRVVSQQDRCDAFLAGSDEDGAERSLPDGELYFLVSEGSSSLSSMIRHAFATKAAFSHSIEGPSGLQRLQGRNPVAFALSRVS